MPEPLARPGHPQEFVMATERDGIHIDVFDRAARAHWAARFGVSEERLRKAIRMVGSRIATVAAYLGQPPR